MLLLLCTRKKILMDRCKVATIKEFLKNTMFWKHVGVREPCMRERAETKWTSWKLTSEKIFVVFLKEVPMNGEIYIFPEPLE